MQLSYAEHLFRYQTSANPALFFQSESQQPKVISWEEMKQQTAALRTFMIAEGLNPGDRIAGILGNQPEATWSLLAANSLGAIWSSCSPEFGVPAIGERLSLISPSFLIAVTGYTYGGKTFQRLAAFREIKKQVPSIRKIIWVTEETITLEPDEVCWHAMQSEYSSEHLVFLPLPFDYPLYILFSSGTTGKPKAIVHRQGGVLLEHLKYLVLHNDVLIGEKYFWYTSTGWMMWNFLQSTLATGAIPVLYDGHPLHPNTATLWELAGKAEIAHFGCSPAYLKAIERLNFQPEAHRQLANLRTISATGAPVTAEQYQYVERIFSGRIPLISMSGGTDVCTAFAGACPWKPIQNGFIQARCLGAPLYAFSPNGERLTNQEGELVLTGPMPSMPLSFWADTGMETYRKSYFEKFPGIWWHGDWVTITEDGYLQLTGRSDTTLNRHGVRMGTAEIYQELDSIDFLTDSLIIHVRISAQDERLILLLSLAGVDHLSEDQHRAIRKTLSERLSPRHIPDEILVIPEIPYTLSGKKVELPVKRLFELGPSDRHLNPESLRNPEVWRDMEALYDKWKGETTAVFPPG